MATWSGYGAVDGTESTASDVDVAGRFLIRTGRPARRSSAARCRAVSGGRMNVRRVPGSGPGRDWSGPISSVNDFAGPGGGAGRGQARESPDAAKQDCFAARYIPGTSGGDRLVGAGGGSRSTREALRLARRGGRLGAEGGAVGQRDGEDVTAGCADVSARTRQVPLSASSTTSSAGQAALQARWSRHGRGGPARQGVINFSVGTRGRDGGPAGGSPSWRILRELEAPAPRAAKQGSTMRRRRAR
jgi:hypothetical protein